MRLVWIVLLSACGGDEASGVCEKACDILVVDCAYSAYPTMDSCMQGCEWRAKQGASMQDDLACIEEAQCDTFAIIECQHAWDAAGE